jgi:hypothetical protein
MLHQFDVAVHVAAMNPVIDKWFGYKPDALSQCNLVTKIPVSRSTQGWVKASYRVKCDSPD